MTPREDAAGRAAAEQAAHWPLNWMISPFWVLGSPLRHTSLVSARLTPQLPNRKPICWLPASCRGTMRVQTRRPKKQRGLFFFTRKKNPIKPWILLHTKNIYHAKNVITIRCMKSRNKTMSHIDDGHTTSLMCNQAQKQWKHGGNKRKNSDCAL